MSKRKVMARLDEIAERASRATEGPWEKDHGKFGTGVVAGRVHTGPNVIGSMWRPSDGTFTAHARADVPWLVEQVRKRDAALRAVLDQVTEWRDESFSFFGGPVEEATSVRYECAQEIHAAIEAALGEVIADGIEQEDPR